MFDHKSRLCHNTQMFKFSRTSFAITVIGIGSVIIAFNVGFSAGSYAYHGTVDDGTTASTTSDGLFSGIFTGQDSEDTSAPPGIDLSGVWAVWHLIDEKYVSTTASTTTDNLRSRVDGMTAGLVESLGDPYTVFMPATETAYFNEEISGNFVGIGVEIGMDDNILTVIAPLKGTPAALAGIRSGDKIIEIDGMPTSNMDTNEAITHIRGNAGTTVTLTVLHRGSDTTVKIPVERDTINIPTVETEARNDGVFVIHLYSFSENSPSLFRDALREFILSGDYRLVLDLRDNPGGYLDAAVDMASFFLPQGTIVAREDFGGNTPENIYRSKGYDIFTDQLKMAILINQGSASASEILAGALSEHHIATLIGEKSFGKGSVQELIPLNDGASLKVTVAKWLTPNGHSLIHNGLDPQITATTTKKDIEAGTDPQLERAAQFLIKGS